MPKQINLNKGDMLRIDSTVTDSNIHEPTDSSLLWDSVRTMIRLLENAEELTDETIPWVNHQLGAKRKAHAIFNTKGQEEKVPLYKNLLNFTYKTLGYIEIAEEIVRQHSPELLMSELWCSELAHYKPLILNVIDQTERRVLQGENVPAAEKIFSIFEEHTDIIIKGARDIQYGHKLNLCSGKSGLILDVVIETGNPADTSRFLPMLERHKEHYDIAISDPEGRTLVLLTSIGAESVSNFKPLWRPPGAYEEMIAYTSNLEMTRTERGIKRNDVWIARPDGTDARNLTQATSPSTEEQLNELIIMEKEPV